MGKVWVYAGWGPGGLEPPVGSAGGTENQVSATKESTTVPTGWGLPWAAK